MIDLDLMVENFLDKAVRLYGDTFLKYDSLAVSALKDRDQSDEARQIRHRHVRSFLQYYGVFRGLDNTESNAIVNEILGFADAQNMTISPTNDKIMEMFGDLHDRCSSKVHRNKDGTSRDLTSLTSKALWCCYPDDIPIFDSRAGRALCVVSHLMEIAPPSNMKRGYEPFLSVWKDLYGRVEHTIDKNRQSFVDIHHKVRVFDMILWTIGDPNF